LGLSRECGLRGGALSLTAKCLMGAVKSQGPIMRKGDCVCKREPKKKTTSTAWRIDHQEPLVRAKVAGTYTGIRHNWWQERRGREKPSRLGKKREMGLPRGPLALPGKVGGGSRTGSKLGGIRILHNPSEPAIGLKI